MQQTNRRRAERQQIAVPVRMGDSEGETENVSPGGVLMYMDTAPEIGSHITFEMELPPGPFRGVALMKFEAEVIRVEDRGGRQAVAARFLDWKLADAEGPG